jgi:nitrite reductase/ring-hydroxylating ferredoxin subunit
MERERHVICAAEELPPGSRTITTLRRRSIGVFNVDGAYYAVTNMCPHHRAPLCVGPVTQEITSRRVGEYELKEDGNPLIRCPWHSFEFDMSTGRSIVAPDRYRVAVYDAACEDGEVVVYM